MSLESERDKLVAMWNKSWDAINANKNTGDITATAPPPVVSTPAPAQNYKAAFTSTNPTTSVTAGKPEYHAAVEPRVVESGPNIGKLILPVIVILGIIYFMKRKKVF